MRNSCTPATHVCHASNGTSGVSTPISKFNGETGGENVTFEEWIEQFEMVATIAHWDKSSKLVISHYQTNWTGLCLLQVMYLTTENQL